MRFFALFGALLGDNKSRAVLSFVSIGAVFALYAYLSAVDRAFSADVSVAGQERVIVRNRASIILPLPGTQARIIEEIDGVVDATGVTWFGGRFRGGRHRFTQLAVDPQRFLAAHPGIALDARARDAWQHTPRGAVVGRALADRFGWVPGDDVPLETALWPQRDGSRLWVFRIVGIFNADDGAFDEGQLLFRHDYLDANREEERAHRVGWYVVRVEDPGAASVVAAAIERRFANTADAVRAETESAFVESFVRQIGDIGDILRTVLAAVFGTAVWVSVATLVRETRKHLGVLALLKALGFGSVHLLGLIAGAVCLFSLVAAGSGFQVGAWLVGRGDPTGGSLPGFGLPPTAPVKAALWALGLGLVSLGGSVSAVLRAAPASGLRNGTP